MKELNFRFKMEYMTPYILVEENRTCFKITGSSSVGDFCIDNDLFPITKPKFYRYGVDEALGLNIPEFTGWV